MEQVSQLELFACGPRKTHQPELLPYDAITGDVFEPKREERIDVEQVSHGKSLSNSATWSLVRIGASGPALRTGMPVIGSETTRAFLWRFLRGTKTMRSSSI